LHISALSYYCKVAGARHKLDVRFSRLGRERVVGPEASLAIFRILQESLTNVSKHYGKGTVVEVALSFSSGAATLVVQDHGKGFELPPAGEQLVGHYGLANMRERARKVGARVGIKAAPGKGTRIELTV